MKKNYVKPNYELEIIAIEDNILASNNLNRESNDANNNGTDFNDFFGLN